VEFADNVQGRLVFPVLAGDAPQLIAGHNRASNSTNSRQFLTIVIFVRFFRKLQADFSSRLIAVLGALILSITTTLPFFIF
jgi:hypothetical protein